MTNRCSDDTSSVSLLSRKSHYHSYLPPLDPALLDVKALLGFVATRVLIFTYFPHIQYASAVSREVDSVFTAFVMCLPLTQLMSMRFWKHGATRT